MSETLDTLRAEINEIDTKLVTLIAERMQVANQIGKEKQTIGMDVLDQGRENEVILSLQVQARSVGIDPTIVEQVWPTLFAASRSVQQK